MATRHLRRKQPKEPKEECETTSFFFIIEIEFGRGEGDRGQVGRISTEWGMGQVLNFNFGQLEIV